MKRISDQRIISLPYGDINMYQFRFIGIFVNVDMLIKIFIQRTNLARKMHKIEIWTDLLFCNFRWQSFYYHNSDWDIYVACYTPSSLHPWYDTYLINGHISYICRGLLHKIILLLIWIQPQIRVIFTYNIHRHI